MIISFCEVSMIKYEVIFLSNDPDDLTVYGSIDFGTDKDGAYGYCISLDWQFDGMLLDILELNY